MTFEDFMHAEASQMWHGLHLKHSLKRAGDFCRYKSYGKLGLNEITPVHIQDFIGSIEGVSESTRNRYRAAIGAVLRHALDLELIEKMPKIRYARVRSGRVRYMNEEEITGLRTFLRESREPWMEHFVVIALSTGMRLGELLSLTPSSIESDKDGTWINLTETKNGDDRAVPVNDACLNALKALDFFPARHFERKRFYNTWRKARNKVAPGDNTFVFHTLRHTAASTMANDLEINTIIIGRMLGHRSQVTTAKYVHEKRSYLQTIAKQLGS